MCSAADLHSQSSGPGALSSPMAAPVMQLSKQNIDPRHWPPSSSQTNPNSPFRRVIGQNSASDAPETMTV